MKRCVFSYVCYLSFLLCMCSQVKAEVVITGTRVVYPGDARDVSIKLTNGGTQPALVQAWIDSGDPRQLPEKSDAPFVLTPPITRVDPGKGQTLRLMLTEDNLPKTRESLFWLNVLEVPPTATEGAAENDLQLAFRSRIKVFYRPSKLPGSQIEAPKQLTWSLVQTPSGWALKCNNPTPYYLTLVSISIVDKTQTYRSEQGGMISPAGEVIFPIKELSGKPSIDAQVDFTAINDYGGVDTHKNTLEQ